MELTCETAVLADAVSAAARVSPKGDHYAAGVGLAFDSRNRVTVTATDLQTSYWCHVNAMSVDSGYWRLPATLLSGLLTGFPQEGTVTLTQVDDGRVRVAHKRSRATLHQIIGEPVNVDLVSGPSLVEISDFGAKIAQVSWACHRDVEPKTGIHIDGKRLVGCDGSKVATVECEVPLEAPITVPLTTLAGLLKNTDTVRLGATQTKLVLMPDDNTQLTSTIYSEPYLAYEKGMRENFAQEAKIDRVALSQAITKMLVLTRAEQFPSMKLIFGDGVLSLSMAAPGVGLMEADLDMDGGALGSFEIHMTPRNLVGALNGATSDSVLLRYGPERLQSLSVQDGDYRADVMPRNDW